MREGISRHSGYEINTEGDAFQVAFQVGSLRLACGRCSIDCSCTDKAQGSDSASYSIVADAYLRGAAIGCVPSCQVLHGRAV